MEREILEKEIKIARKRTLDLIEAILGHSKNWPFIRSQILKIYGSNGLSKVTNPKFSKSLD